MGPRLDQDCLGGHILGLRFGLTSGGPRRWTGGGVQGWGGVLLDLFVPLVTVATLNIYPLSLLLTLNLSLLIGLLRTGDQT